MLDPSDAEPVAVNEPSRSALLIGYEIWCCKPGISAKRISIPAARHYLSPSARASVRCNARALQYGILPIAVVMKDYHASVDPTARFAGGISRPAAATRLANRPVPVSVWWHCDYQRRRGLRKGAGRSLAQTVSEWIPESLLTANAGRRGGRAKARRHGPRTTRDTPEECEKLRSSTAAIC